MLWFHYSGIGQLLEETGQCVTICEPNSISQIVGKYRRFGATPEIRQLAYDIVRMECRPYRSFQPAAYVIKVIGRCSSAMPLFGYASCFLLLDVNATHTHSANCTLWASAIYRSVCRKLFVRLTVNLWCKIEMAEPTIKRSNSNFKFKFNMQLDCGPMPNVTVALSNIRGTLCSTPQSLARAHWSTAVQ